MAFTHLYFNANSTHGPLLRQTMNSVESGLNGLASVLSVMKTMIDGDGSDPAQFTECAARFGFPDNATAFAAWNELNSCDSKISVDATVDHVNAALVQAIAKFK